MIGRRHWFTVRVVEENVTGIIAVLVAGAGVDAGYGKLGVTSRVQLAQLAARHA